MDHVHCHCPDYRIRDHDSRTGTSGRRRSVHRLWPTSRPTSCPTLATWAGLFSLSSVASHQTRRGLVRSEEHTSELQSLMRISYAVFCLKKKKHKKNN